LVFAAPVTNHKIRLPGPGLDVPHLGCHVLVAEGRGGEMRDRVIVVDDSEPGAFAEALIGPCGILGVANSRLPKSINWESDLGREGSRVVLEGDNEERGHGGAEGVPR